LIEDSGAETNYLRWTKIEILNVAGNRESKAPGIYQQVHDTIVAAFGGK